MTQNQPTGSEPDNAQPGKPVFLQKDGKLYVQYVKGGDYYSLPYVQTPDCVHLSSLAKAISQIELQKAKRRDVEKSIYIDVAEDTAEPTTLNEATPTPLFETTSA